MVFIIFDLRVSTCIKVESFKGECSHLLRKYNTKSASSIINQFKDCEIIFIINEHGSIFCSGNSGMHPIK